MKWDVSISRDYWVYPDMTWQSFKIWEFWGEFWGIDMGSLTAANWVSFDFNVSYSSCWGYSLINTLEFKKKSPATGHPPRCVSHTLKECVGYHTVTKIFVCGTLEFSKIAYWNSQKWVWDDAGGGCNLAVPNLPPDVLTDGPRASQYTPAQPTSRRGRLGTATIQPPPALSHTHF